MKTERDIPASFIEGESILYPVTEVEVQEIAEERIGRELTEEEIGLIRDRVNEELMWIIPEEIDDIEEYSELEEAGAGNEKANPRYEILWKNENAFQNEFKLSDVFANVDDARAFASHKYTFGSAGDEYKIEEIKDEVRQTIVHHKNPLNGGDGFHMDVHTEPKSAQNHHDQNF